MPLCTALDGVLKEMENFFAHEDEHIRTALSAQRDKISDKTRRYACRVRAQFEGNYLRSGLRRAAEIQENFYV